VVTGFQFILVAIAFLALGVSVGLFVSTMRMRRKRTVDPKKSAAEESSMGMSNTTEKTLSSSKEPEKVEKVIIEDEFNSPVLQIEPYTGDYVGRWEKVELPQKVLSKLSAAFSSMPLLLFSVPLSSPRVYLVRFSQPFDHLMRSNGVYKAVALRPDGTITGLPNVLSPGFYRFLGSAATVWAILAVITRQKYLHDIEQRLKKIEEGVADIKEFLEKERDTGIQGNLLYLKQVYEALKNGDLSEYDINSFNSQLESIERQCQQAVLHYQIDMENCFKKLEEFEIGAWTGKGLKKQGEEFRKVLNSFFHYSKYLLLVFQERLVTIYLKTFLPVGKSILRVRINDLKESLRFLERTRKIEEFIEQSLDRIEEFWALFTSEKTENQIKRSLRQDVRRNLRELEEMRERLYESLANFEERLNQLEAEKQVNLVVFMDQDHKQIKEVRMIPAGGSA
jgi:hypothetical protein